MKKIRSNMGDADLLEVLRESRPTDPFVLNFSGEDVEKAVAFWLNNVVLRMPVEVTHVRKHGDRYSVEVMVITQ